MMRGIISMVTLAFYCLNAEASKGSVRYRARRNSEVMSRAPPSSRQTACQCSENAYGSEFVGTVRWGGKNGVEKALEDCAKGKKGKMEDKSTKIKVSFPDDSVCNADSPTLACGCRVYTIDPEPGSSPHTLRCCEAAVSDDSYCSLYKGDRSITCNEGAVLGYAENARQPGICSYPTPQLWSRGRWAQYCSTDEFQGCSNTSEDGFGLIDPQCMQGQLCYEEQCGMVNYYACGWINPDGDFPGSSASCEYNPEILCMDDNALPDDGLCPLGMRCLDQCGPVE